MFLLLIGCVTLREGDYGVDYDPATVDDCNILDGVPLADDQGELEWEGDSFSIDLDAAGDVGFDVDGTDIARDTTSTNWLDDNCSLSGDEEDRGEITSATTFEGESTFVYTFAGSCGMYQMVYATPCHVTFAWQAQIDD
jgi:hypothetical protein